MGDPTLLGLIGRREMFKYCSIVEAVSGSVFPGHLDWLKYMLSYILFFLVQFTNKIIFYLNEVDQNYSPPILW
jgi:hypothetical protein